SLTAIGQSNPDYFYYYKNKKVPLERNTDYIYLVMQPNVSSQTQLKVVLGSDVEITKFGQSNVGRTLRTANSTTTRSSEYWAEVKLNSRLPYTEQLNRLKDNPSIALVAPYFKTKTETKIGLSNYFYVKLRSEYDLNVLLETAESTQTQIVGQNKFMPLWYTLKCTGTSYYNALEAANFFYESGRFAAAEPDLMVDALLNTVATTASKSDEALYLVPNDPLYGNQWGLNNTGQNGGTAGIDVNAEAAWDITTGNSGVVVAVLDHGFEMNHPDLAANTFGTGFDTVNGIVPSVVRGSHGTACAGIVGAVQNNSLGVSGVAPNTSLMSVSSSLLLTPNIRQELADGINWSWQNGADIISNSWGSDLLASTLIDNAITNALTNGRGGLGTIIVFATGNNNGPVSYPANSNPDIIAVGAMSPCGERKNPNSCDGEGWWGSNFGNTLDVIAPGVLIPTTDRQGAAGYDNDDYADTFNGTSSACPHVAGVAALVLGVNPNLTVQEVNTIIEQSAQKVGGYNYQNTPGRPNGTWDDEAGYGLVDAHAAVLLAQNCQDNLVVNQDVLGGTTDNQEANQTITATNTIFTNATAVYHAGNQVLLQPGFHSQSGAEFHAYVEGCSGIFQAKMQVQDTKTQEPVTYVPEEQQNAQIDLEEVPDSREFIVFPNPFTEILHFKYTVKQQDSRVLLTLYTATGREVSTLVREQRSAKGSYHVEFNGNGLPEGLYLYRLEIGDTVKTGKIVLKK
ncbi:MAG: S8 family serine peptidase, partial [Bacteroidota bacterium]